MGWRLPWVSAAPDDFNYDFGGSYPPEQVRGFLPDAWDGLPRIVAQNAAATGTDIPGYLSESPAASVFTRHDGAVYQTYATSARGVEFVMGYYPILDRTPNGRDESDGFQTWIRRRDEYAYQPGPPGSPWTEILEQSIERELFLDTDVAAAHGGGESGSQGVAAGSPVSPGERRQRMRRRHRGLVGLVVVSPRPPVHPLPHRAGNPDAAPVEVAVVTELRAAGREQFQQPPPGSGGLAADADQRLAPGTQLVGGSRDHHRVLANPHRERRAQRLVMAAELAEREHRRLSRLAARRQHPAQRRTRVAGQAEAEHQRRQLVEVDADGGPGGAAGIGGSLRRERQAGQRADRRQRQRADRAPVVQGVRITAAFGGEPADGDAAARAAAAAPPRPARGSARA